MNGTHHVREPATAGASPMFHPSRKVERRGSHAQPTITVEHPAGAPYRGRLPPSGLASYLRKPDYCHISTGLPIVGPLGVKCEMVKDRYGRVYGGLGFSLCASASFPVDVGATYLNQVNAPGRDTLHRKLSGLSFGSWAGAGMIYSRAFNGGPTSTSVANSAGIGVSSTYSMLIRG